MELVDKKSPDRVCFINEDSPEATKLSDPDLKESRAVPWRRTYGPASNGQLLDRWLALVSLSLFVLYALVNPDFGTAGKNLLLSTQIIPPMALLTGIVLIFFGGSLKRNKKNTKLYRALFAIGGLFMILLAILSFAGLSGYTFLLNPIFAIAAAIVIIVEAFFVWWISTREGRKATV